jgi:hypothetical protein
MTRERPDICPVSETSFCHLVEPRAIKTADKRLFYATGAGDLYIDVPNGAETSTALLKDALHAPDIGVTLVSVSQIAKARHTVSFTGDFRVIKNHKGAVIGGIPKNSNGLCKVQHDEANVGHFRPRKGKPSHAPPATRSHVSGCHSFACSTPRHRGLGTNGT